MLERGNYTMKDGYMSGKVRQSLTQLLAPSTGFDKIVYNSTLDNLAGITLIAYDVLWN